MIYEKSGDDLVIVTVIYSSELRGWWTEKEVREMDLVIKYDPKADILTTKLSEGTIKDEKLLESDVVLGF